MCGRYAAGKERDALALEFHAEIITNRRLPPRWNIAPTSPIYIIKDVLDGGIRQRELAVAAWGLVPAWAADMSIGAKMANARCETVASKPSFRAAFARRRCLVPVDGWYEWMAADPGMPAKLRPPKQPYYFSAGSAPGASTALAGIYEWWRNPQEPESEPLLSAAIITTDAYGDLARIHNRTPVIVPESQWARWLDPTPSAAPAAALAGLLGGLPETSVRIHAVSTRVNSARVDEPDLIQPVAEPGALVQHGASDTGGSLAARGSDQDPDADPGQTLLF